MEFQFADRQWKWQTDSGSGRQTVVVADRQW